MQLNLAIFASGRGSNFQAISNAIAGGTLQARVALLITDNAAAGAVRIAQQARIAVAVIPAPSEVSAEDCASEMLCALQHHGVNFIVLCGYLRKIPIAVIRHYRGRIINLHPALLPSFGGKGMYGRRVHEAVLHYGCKVTGATVHFVEEDYDSGPPIAQRCVPVRDDDTPDSLAGRVLEVEHTIMPEVLQWFAEERVTIEGRRVRVRHGD